jgi:GntR family transcriptional regulator/MocR family aminotransferase
MPLARRLELLRWAEAAGAWILEDDYDGEYRFAGPPLPALQGLDRAGRVLYVGTFSKTMFPSLRIGYIVVPADLVDTFTRARTLADGHAAPIAQAILADFMDEGHFARHVRRMRALYAMRQEQLLAAARDLQGLIRLDPSQGGLHLIGWMPPGVDDRVVSAALAARGVEAPALSRHYTDASPPSGALLLGFAALDEAALRKGMSALHDVLQREGRGRERYDWNRSPPR